MNAHHYFFFTTGFGRAGRALADGVALSFSTLRPDLKA